MPTGHFSARERRRRAPHAAQPQGPPCCAAASLRCRHSLRSPHCPRPAAPQWCGTTARASAAASRAAPAACRACPSGCPPTTWCGELAEGVLLPAGLPVHAAGLAGASCVPHPGGREAMPAGLPPTRPPARPPLLPPPLCSQYWLGGNNGWYKENVRRSPCQVATGDDWCEQCEGSRCTACFTRPPFGQTMGGHPIVLSHGKVRPGGRPVLPAAGARRCQCFFLLVATTCLNPPACLTPALHSPRRPPPRCRSA